MHQCRPDAANLGQSREPAVKVLLHSSCIAPCGASETEMPRAGCQVARNGTSHQTAKPLQQLSQSQAQGSLLNARRDLKRPNRHPCADGKHATHRNCGLCKSREPYTVATGNACAGQPDQRLPARESLEFCPRTMATRVGARVVQKLERISKLCVSRSSNGDGASSARTHAFVTHPGQEPHISGSGDG